MSAPDLPPDRPGALARVVEDAQRALARVRYGSVFHVGAARCVLNPDSPLPTANFAASVDGAPARVEAALRRLPAVFAEAGRPEVVLVDSPSCLPELGVLAEENGYEAAEEEAVLLLTRPALLAEGEPGRVVTPVAEADEHAVHAVLAEAGGVTGEARRHLARVTGHRLDDPRYTAYGVRRAGDLVGVAGAFVVVEAGLGLVVDLAVAPGARRRGYGRALASAAAADCLTRGAGLVVATGETRGPGERFWTDLGFEPAYDTVTYTYDL